MKIQRLDLIAFGPFTNLSLDLSEGDEGLHIIFGPNESGKSSSLRALRQLLYGIPQQSTDNFLHAHANMRIGGQLLHTDGTALPIVRRKGRTNTLRDAADDTALDESILHKFLDGLKQTFFESMFGIDHADLIAGGQALCKGKGELGQILFAAGAGVADVHGISEKLSQASDALFLPGGSKPIINAALAQLKDAQKEQKELEIPSSEWEKHDEALKEASIKKAALERELSQKGQAIGKFQRIKDALLPVAERKELLKTLEDLKRTILLPEDFGDRSRQLQLEQRGTISAEENISSAIDELTKELATIQIPEGLVEQAAVIEDLQRQLGSYQKAMHDRSGLVVRLNQLEDAIRTGLKNLGHPPDLTLCDQLRITVSERTQIRDLATSKSAVETQCENARTKLEQLKRHIEITQSNLLSLKDPPQPERLSKAVKRIEQMGSLETQMKTARAQFESANAQLAVDVQKLKISDSTSLTDISDNKNWDKLESLAVPAAETIDRFHTDMEAQIQLLKTLRKNLDQAEQERQRIDQQLEQLRLEMETPTEDDLLTARQKRDRGWQLVKRSWKERDENLDAIAEFVGQQSVTGGLAEAYEESVNISDTLADRLRREANQVAKKAALIAETCKQSQRISEFEQQIRECVLQQDQLQQSWAGVWCTAAISPLPPKEMRSWSLRFAEAVKQGTSVRESLIHLRALEENIVECKQELSTLLEELGEQPTSTGESLAGLIERCQQVIDHSNGIKSQRTTLSRDLEKQQNEQTKAGQDSSVAELALELWTTEWSSAVKPLALEGNTSPSQANAVIDTLDPLFKNLADAQDLNNRVNGIDRDAKDFAANVQKMVTSVAPDLVDFPPAQATAELNARLAKGRTNKERFDVLTKEKGKKLEALQVSQSKIRECKDELDLMCQESHCKSYEDLITAAESSASLRKNQIAMEQVEKHLLKLSGGASLDEFVQEVLGVDPDVVEPTMTQLQQEIAESQQLRTELDQAIGREQAELARINGGAQAAEAAERVQALLAKVGTDSEQYARMRVAKFILNRCIERYRDRNQSPVLKRASEIFAELTLGSFNGLREDFNDRGEPILVGSRPAGTLVGIEGMSDGTCDQAYLALRLASLEIYLENHEPVPFIVDDILVNFDDDRSSAALHALADFSKRTQIIFFTHHVHLVRLAEKSIKSGELFIHELSGVPMKPRIGVGS